jgi:hypothetical protein
MFKMQHLEVSGAVRHILYMSLGGKGIINLVGTEMLSSLDKTFLVMGSTQKL